MGFGDWGDWAGSALIIFLATYTFSLVTDVGRSVLEILFNFFIKRGSKKIQYVLSPAECAIVIPCHNSEETIAQTLATLPKGYKVFCIANACRDNTVKILEQIRKTNPAVNVFVTPEPGKIRAVLVGALLAKKEGFTHFMLLDDDVEFPETAYLKVYNPNRAITALPVIPTKDNLNWLRAAQSIEYQMMCASKRAQDRLGNVIMASGAAGIYRMDSFLHAIQSHDGEHIGDDLQCSYIHHTMGYKIDFMDELVVKTHPPLTIKAWWKQRAKRWEASPVFNVIWALRIIFAPVFGDRNPGWWIRGVTLYRTFVIINDMLRCYSFPIVLMTTPKIVLGIWAITYCTVLGKMLTFRTFFKNESYAKVDPITVFSVLTYPLYGALMWVSRVRAIPKGIALNWKYYIKGKRKTSTLASSISLLEREIA